MAALLRHGARRVDGSLVQRTRPAFTTPAAAEERRLLTTERARPVPPKDPQACLREIQERKEELYDLLSLVLGQSTVRNNYRNRQLLKFLSAQVKPRPDDYEWRKMRSTRRERYVTDTIILGSTCVLGYECLCDYLNKGGSAQTAKKQEQ